ncbi:hypothetical protein BT96DRAFT_131224 [Gymnopus androsaceus JB14]|uniref:Uncharacterized protein n=1 Tax=Gymnopus androsaceus JB14 TaxID=1447944 RepID=A0A6A4IE80_9AGAR|nr:hypothetical protein BT96DRAFT_131224 [Gymnopus androsaceus JB14]
MTWPRFWVYIFLAAGLHLCVSRCSLPIGTLRSLLGSFAARTLDPFIDLPGRWKELEFETKQPLAKFLAYIDQFHSQNTRILVLEVLNLEAKNSANLILGPFLPGFSLIHCPRTHWSTPHSGPTISSISAT